MSFFSPKAMPQNLQSAAEQAADALLNHARSHIYSGPPTQSVEYYSGWPISELIALLPRRDPLIIIALMQRIRGLGLYPANLPAYSPQMPVPSSPPSSPSYSHQEMLRMRMRWGLGKWATGFEHVALHSTKDIVHMWVITRTGSAVMLEDEAGIFPSDALITKLRLLQQE